MIDLCITVWLFFSFSSFRTIILLFWFQIFKLLSISKLFFHLSFSSDLNVFTQFSGIDFYFSFAHSDIQFLSSIKYSLIFKTGFIVFVPYIVCFKYIIFQKRLEKSGFLLKSPNMFLSKISVLDSVEHDPKQLSMLVYFGMGVISKSLISEHLQGKKNSKFIIVFL